MLVVLLSRLERPGEVWGLLARAEAAPLALALGLNLVPLWLKVVRWQVLLRTRGIHYATRPALLGFSASLYLGMLTPGRVGDVLRIHYLRHDTGARYADGLAFLVVDRLADLWVIVAFTAYAVARWSALLSPELAQLGWIVIAGSILAPLPLFVPRVADAILRRIYRKVAREADADGPDVFLATLRRAARGAVVPVLGLTIAAYGVNFAQGWLLARAMDLPVGFVDAACLQSVQGLLGLLPISVSGLGVREATFAAIFPALGSDAAAGTSYGLALFVVIYVSQVLVGAIAWQIRPPPARASEVVVPGASTPPADAS
jgi:uncharacterized protein (TIRG00374 family)